MKFLIISCRAQFLKAVIHFNLINNNFSFENALSVLLRITKQTSQSLEVAIEYEKRKQKEQIEKAHHIQQQQSFSANKNRFMLHHRHTNNNLNEAYETSTNNSESQFDSDSDPDDYISDEEIENLDETSAMIKAAGE